MTERKRPGPLPAIARNIQTYLFNRDEASTFTKAKDKVKKAIIDFVKANGEVELDESGNEVTGNIVYRLPDPIQVGSKVYAGMELRRQPQIDFDEDAALDLAKAKGIPVDQVTHTVTVVDQEAFYVLNQQKKITDEELDSLLVESDPKYSLWPLET